MHRTVRPAIIGSSLALAVVVAAANITTALGVLDDQLSATPLPILTSSPSAPPAPSPDVTETVASALPQVGEQQSDPGTGAGTSAPAAPTTTASATLSIQTNGPDADAAPSPSPSAATPAAATTMPTYGGIKYNTRSTPSSASGATAGPSDAAVVVGPVDESAVSKAADLNADGFIDAAEAAAAQSRSADSNESAQAPVPTITAVPGFGAGLTFLVLLGGIALLARRLRA